FPDHVARVLTEEPRVVRVERIRRGFVRQSRNAATDVVAGVWRERIRRREHLKLVAALDGLIVEPEIALDEAVARADRRLRQLRQTRCVETVCARDGKGNLAAADDAQ